MSSRSLFTGPKSPSKQGSTCQDNPKLSIHPAFFPEYCRKLSISPAMWFN